jgi:hypothetical protein
MSIMVKLLLSYQWQGAKYGGIKVTCVCFNLSRAHEILCRGHELLSRGHEIAKSCARDTMSCSRVTKSWSRDC